MRYLTKADVTTIFKMLCGGIPNAKFTPDTVKSWMMMFGHIDRLKLMECAKQYMLKVGIFFPKVAEMNAELRAFDHRNTYWQPPSDKKDERCMWFMACNGIADPSGLTQAQIDTIYEVDHDDIIDVHS